MKRIYEDESLASNVISALTDIHSALTHTRGLLKELEELVLTLEGESFGDLTVMRKIDRFRVEDNNELYLPMWACICSCGEEIKVRHDDLIAKKVESCGCKDNKEKDLEDIITTNNKRINK